MEAPFGHFGTESLVASSFITAQRHSLSVGLLMLLSCDVDGELPRLALYLLCGLTMGGRP